MTLDEILREIEDAGQRFDAARQDELARSLLTTIWRADPSLDESKRVVRALRAQRRFASLEQVASTLLASGRQEFEIKAALAQALIDQGKIETALAALGRWAGGSSHPELAGLMGRAYKQLYVDASLAGVPAGSAELRTMLRTAFDYYAREYVWDPELTWHGINAVALAMRAEHDGLDVGRAFDARRAAGEIRETVHRQIQAGKADRWAHGTLMEVAVALGLTDEALREAASYVTVDRLDAFAFAGSLRQLREIWRIDESVADWRLVTAMLEARVVKGREGARVTGVQGAVRPPFEDARARVARAVDPRADPAAEDPCFERNFGGVFVTLANYRRGLACADAVSWLSRSRDRPAGTGFLLRGDLIHPAWGSGLVLVTNAHVLDVDGGYRGAALRPATAEVRFEVGPNAGKMFKIAGAPLWRSPPDAFDATIWRLSPEPTEGGLTDVAPQLPDPKEAPPPHVYVIGHPLGGSLVYSLDDNLLLDHDGVRVHYRAPTEPGSSGSPVLDRQWELIALHHAGRPSMPKLHGSNETYAANEGIAIAAIRAAIVEAASKP